MGHIRPLIPTPVMGGKKMDSALTHFLNWPCPRRRRAHLEPRKSHWVVFNQGVIAPLCTFSRQDRSPDPTNTRHHQHRPRNGGGIYLCVCAESLESNGASMCVRGTRGATYSPILSPSNSACVDDRSVWYFCSLTSFVFWDVSDVLQDGVWCSRPPPVGLIGWRSRRGRRTKPGAFWGCTASAWRSGCWSCCCCR